MNNALCWVSFFNPTYIFREVTALNSGGGAINTRGGIIDTCSQQGDGSLVELTAAGDTHN
jgi:hypothetical protein